MKTRNGRRRSRDREATSARILDAVGRVLSRRGFGDLGVNVIAREARVDKVLIYRYFGGLPKLLAAFARRAEFWPDDEELLRDAPPPPVRPAAVAAAALKGLLRGLRSRPLTQEVLRWELTASNQLTGRLASVREEQGVRTLRRVALGGEDLADTDVPAVAALLSAGLTYLVLRASSGQPWLGVSLQSEEGWTRIERAIELTVARVLDGEPPARGGRDEGLTSRVDAAPDRRRRRPRLRSRGSGG